MTKGWYGNRYGHKLASKGIKSRGIDYQPLLDFYDEDINQYTPPDGYYIIEKKRIDPQEKLRRNYVKNSDYADFLGISSDYSSYTYQALMHFNDAYLELSDFIKDKIRNEEISSKRELIRFLNDLEDFGYHIALIQTLMDDYLSYFTELSKYKKAIRKGEKFLGTTNLDDFGENYWYNLYWVEENFGDGKWRKYLEDE